MSDGSYIKRLCARCPSGRRLRVAVAAVVLASGSASAETVDVQYGLTLAGLSIGSASLTGTVTRENYKLDVKARMTGLAGMMTSGRGAGAASGSTASGRVQPSSYALTSGGSSTTYTVRMSLNAGNVAAVDISPPLDEKVDRVPVLDTHKRGVVDPVSALLMPVSRSASLLDQASCNRTLPVFDGAGRFDVALSFSATRAVSVPGYAGPVLVCSARYNPVSGHRTNRKSTQFMADNRDMEIWLAPIEGAHALVPVKIAVKTMVGMTVIEATRFTVTRAAGAAPPAPSTAAAVGSPPAPRN
jgi:hypothetical protein